MTRKSEALTLLEKGVFMMSAGEVKEIWVPAVICLHFHVELIRKAQVRKNNNNKLIAVNAHQLFLILIFNNARILYLAT